MATATNDNIPATEPELEEYPFLIQEARPLSESLVWNLLRDFYTDRGIDAWVNGGVPRYITSNPYIAGGYAHMVRAFLEDVRAHETRAWSGKPPLVVELGSGSGAFAYHFLRAYYGDSPDGESSTMDTVFSIQYVMTDLAESNLRFQKEHPRFQRFREAGILNFARFDLQHQKLTELEQYEEDRPLIVIANYIFDSLPQDVFRFQENRMFEGLMSLHAKEQPPETLTPEMVGQMHSSWMFRATSPDFYDNPDWNDVLRWYSEEFSEANIAVSPFAMRVLDTRQTSEAAPLLLLIGDRGEIRARDLTGKRPPMISAHGESGCFSLGFNFHALELLTRARGGRVLRTEHAGAWLNVVAHALGNPIPRLRDAYHNQVMQPGPDDFYTIVHGVEKKYGTMNMAEILALLRFSRWDPSIFVEVYPVLHERLRDADEAQKHDLAACLPRIRDAYYRVNPDDDFNFRLGYLAFSINEFKSSIEFFEASVQEHGEHTDKFFNIALCHHFLKHADEATAWNERALELDSNNEEAAELRRILASGAH